MIENPGILKKAQKELDGVCGTERCPSPQDMDKLPYIRAIMTEVYFLPQMMKCVMLTLKFARH